MQKILLLEDDSDLRSEIVEALEEEAFEVVEAGTVEAFWVTYKSAAPDLLILDMTLPDGRGLSVARQVRRTSDIGILFLSGRQDETDRIVALEIGADDFVVKPCSPRELIARVNAILRRTNGNTAKTVEIEEPAAPPPPPSAPAAGAIGFAGYVLDLAAMELRDPRGDVCTLTTAEFDLLRAFVERPQRVLGRDLLLDLIRGTDWAGYDRTIDGLISRLRKKLVHEDGQTQILRTVRVSGYIFTQPITALKPKAPGAPYPGQHPGASAL